MLRVYWNHPMMDLHQLPATLGLASWKDGQELKLALNRSQIVDNPMLRSATLPRMMFWASHALCHAIRCSGSCKPLQPSLVTFLQLALASIRHSLMDKAPRGPISRKLGPF
jgi:hypothetical protein